MNGLEVFFSLQNIAIVVSSDIRHAALQRQAKVLRMVSNTRIIGHNHRLVDQQEIEEEEKSQKQNTKLDFCEQTFLLKIGIL